MNGIEKEIEEWLVSKNIYPFSILYSKNPQFLKISFYIDQDIKDLLNEIEYKSICDTSGVQIFKETKTILFNNLGLLNLFRHVIRNQII